nr:hypothetical protein [Paraflavitalea speifideiaquila]
MFARINGINWKKYTCTLKPIGSDLKAKFVINFGSTGTVWLDFVSLFPRQTFKGRPNGMRRDLAQYLADLKPAFVRWPGGCFVEGINIESAANWKRTLGPVEKGQALIVYGVTGRVIGLVIMNTFSFAKTLAPMHCMCSMPAYPVNTAAALLFPRTPCSQWWMMCWMLLNMLSVRSIPNGARCGLPVAIPNRSRLNTWK